MINIAPNPALKPVEAPETKQVPFAEVVRTGTATNPKPVPPQKPNKEDRVTLCAWKLYLNSCDTYSLAFVDLYLENVREVGTILKGSYNADVTTSNAKGLFGIFEMWLNHGGIANLLSIPQLEEDGYHVTYDTDTERVVTPPSGEDIIFK